MKHSECPIRQTAVTLVGGADARWETSGPVRRTETLFFSQQKEISSANNPSTRAHSSIATIAFRTSCQFCCSYGQILTEISHLNSPMWKIPPAGHLQIAKNFKYFTKKTFLFWFIVVHECLLSAERGALQKPVQHWSALSWTSMSQYDPPAASSSATRPKLHIGVTQAGSWPLQLWLLFLENMQCMFINVEDPILHPAESHCKWWRLHRSVLIHVHWLCPDERTLSNASSNNSNNFNNSAVVEQFKTVVPNQEYGLCQTLDSTLHCYCLSQLVLNSPACRWRHCYGCERNLIFFHHDICD